MERTGKRLRQCGSKYIISFGKFRNITTENLICSLIGTSTLQCSRTTEFVLHESDK